jgi:S1-C subfamily serine protease
LLALQGQAIADLADFYRRLWRLGPAGSSVELTVLRDNQTRAVKLVTGDRALSLKRPRGV